MLLPNNARQTNLAWIRSEKMLILSKEDTRKTSFIVGVTKQDHFRQPKTTPLLVNVEPSGILDD